MSPPEKQAGQDQGAEIRAVEIREGESRLTKIWTPKSAQLRSGRAKQAGQDQGAEISIKSAEPAAIAA